MVACSKVSEKMFDRTSTSIHSYRPVGKSFSTILGGFREGALILAATHETPCFPGENASPARLRRSPERRKSSLA
jgi:hypothetical protein